MTSEADIVSSNPGPRDIFKHYFFSVTYLISIYGTPCIVSFMLDSNLQYIDGILMHIQNQSLRQTRLRRRTRSAAFVLVVSSPYAMLTRLTSAGRASMCTVLNAVSMPTTLIAPARGRVR